MEIGSRIELSDWEWDVAKAAGSRRYKSNVDAGIPSIKVDEGRTDLEINVAGCASEIAFCRGFNVYCDLVQEARRSMDDDGDAVVRGMTIDVKSTHHKMGKLIVSSWKNPVDLYALMVGYERNWEFKGVIGGGAMIVPERLKELVPGGAKCYQARQSELKPLEEYA